ncbi:MAG TPA: DUF72 domain-containing protein [Gemmatimonas sp.]|nr:DUF72 domain-containing protein [Gemmatimonas sp.]
MAPGRGMLRLSRWCHGGAVVIRIGTQGWNYPAWTGAFYPTGTRAADFLRVYSRAFDTVEVDSTFYAIPPASTVRGWVNRTSPGFTFSLKLPQEITHERRFVDASDVLDRFADRARELGDRLALILIQCGPDFSPLERSALASFLGALPADLRFAIEFRQRAWITPETLDLLRDHGVAIALSDGRWIPRKWLLQLAARPTAEFSYVRWMGPDRSLVDYSHLQVDRSGELDAWAAALPVLQGGARDVFGYMNNHFAGHAPASARMLQSRLRQPVVDPESLGEQPSLF